MTAALNLIKDLQDAVKDRDAKILCLEEQLAWFKRQLFGKKSERIVSDLNQLYFDGFAPDTLKEEKIEVKKVSAHTRKKPLRNGQDAIQLDPNLPVKTVVIDLPEEEKICKETGVRLVEIGQEKSYKLAYTPGSYYLKETVRPKYAHPQLSEMGVKTALLPESLLQKCQADDSLLAFIITQKFVNHLPLYRQAEQMHREGVTISRKLLSQWILRCGMALKPLYDVMVASILKSEVVYIDESPVKVQAKERCATGYVWVLVGGKEGNPAYRIYDFRSNRSHDNAWEILEGYRGVVHSDKYAAYQRLAEKKVITWCPCFSHIRRKFFEAEAGDKKFRDWVLRKIKYLFMLEKISWGRSVKERLKIRQEKEAPIIDEITERIQSKLIDGKILPKSKFREALGYYMSLSPYLKNYTQHPFARLDNNVGERAVRPLAIGRKNWIFFGSEDGGEAGTILLSFVQTCRGLGINPTEYLEDIFRRLMGHSVKKLEELLPDRWLASRPPQQKRLSINAQPV